MTGANEDPADQFFYWKAIVENGDFTRLMEVRDIVQLPAENGSPVASTAMAIGAFASIVMAAVAVVRSRRSAKQELPMTDEYE